MSAPQLPPVSAHLRLLDAARKTLRSLQQNGFRPTVAAVRRRLLRGSIASRVVPELPAARTGAGVAAPAQSAVGTLNYLCNICGRTCTTAVSGLGREARTCVCGSTVRQRAIVHVLSLELFGESLALPDFPNRPDLRGRGMSDSGYDQLLPTKLGYVNTFYHRDPFLDIAAPLDPALVGTLDFLISSEVLEHIAPPVSRAFENSRLLLKPTGVFVLSVPYTLATETVEHFPELAEYKFVPKPGGGQLLENTTRDGRTQVFDNLVFHGGDGSTLEMRRFARDDLLAALHRAGFGAIRIHSEPCWPFGIYWSEPWSLPISARPMATDSSTASGVE